MFTNAYRDFVLVCYRAKLTDLEGYEQFPEEKRKDEIIISVDVKRN